MAVPAGVARITKKNMVRLSPGMYTAGFAGFVVEASLFCGYDIVGCVDSEPVVTTAEPGSGGAVLVGDRGVGKV